MKRFRLGLLALALAASALPAMAQEALTPEETAALAALEAELPGTLLNNPLYPGWNTYGEDKETKVVRADEIPGGYAYEVKIKRKKPNPWDVSVTSTVTSGVTQGDTVLIAIWARATRPDPDRGVGTVQVRLQQTAAPYAGVAETTLSLRPEWQLHYISGIAPKTFDAGEINLAFNGADLKQTLQFGQVYIMNIGPDVPLSSLPSSPENL